MECSQLAIVERALQNRRDGTKPPLESRGPDVCGTRGDHLARETTSTRFCHAAAES